MEQEEERTLCGLGDAILEVGGLPFLNTEHRIEVALILEALHLLQPASEDLFSLNFR
jgi:hypothetical protein